MLKAESTIGIILVLIFGMSLGFFSSQTFINNYESNLKLNQKDFENLHKQNLETLKENLSLKEKVIELENKK